MGHRKWWQIALLLLIALARGVSCSGAAANEAADGWRLWDPFSSPFIPIPEVGTDPNGGTTLGLLLVYLVKGQEVEIRQIIAPDLVYNPNLGYGAHFRVLSYPSEDTAWRVEAGAMEIIERGADAVYATGIQRQDLWSFFARGRYDRSATPRFFGIGNQSPAANRSNYTMEQEYFEGSLGLNLTPAWQIALQLRPRVVTIEPGILERSIPSQLLGTKVELLNRLLVTYDTRDSNTVPTLGSRFALFSSIAHRSFLSSASYSIVGVDAQHIWPIGERFALAGHAALQYTFAGGDVPFWALNSLGGDRSRLAESQPLRGFGEGRFIDKNVFSTTLELRTKVFDLNLFSTSVSFEATPFADAGRVFHSPSDNPASHLHLVGGVGFRGIAKPFIVGYVDIGYGSEGVAIFSGINYPF
jgi:hypothetical protein